MSAENPTGSKFRWQGFNFIFVYGECSDGNWEACKEHWLRPDSVKWLGDEAARILNKQSNEKASAL